MVPPQQQLGFILFVLARLMISKWTYWWEDLLKIRTSCGDLDFIRNNRVEQCDYFFPGMLVWREITSDTELKSKLIILNLIT